MTDVTAYISGGYFLVKRISRPDGVSELVPDSVLTVSNCFTEIAPDDWAVRGYNYTDEERAKEALKFGIPASVVSGLVDLLSREVGSLHHNAFPALSIAQEFYRECTDTAGVALVGIGLEPSLLPLLYAQLKDDVNHGFGLVERLEAKRPLESGGEPLGYEPLGYDATKFHSWLCHNMPFEAYERFGIRPNRHGFIQSFADAARLTEHMKATGVATAIWEPWLIVQYGI